jgi:hypothetical protein
MFPSLCIILVIFYKIIIYGSGIDTNRRDAQYLNGAMTLLRNKEDASDQGEDCYGDGERGVVFLKVTDSKAIDFGFYESLSFFFFRASMFTMDFNDIGKKEKDIIPKCYAELTETCVLQAFDVATQKKVNVNRSVFTTLYFEHVKIYKNGKVAFTYDLQDCLTFNCLHRPHSFEVFESYASKHKKAFFFQNYISIYVKNLGLHYDVDEHIVYLDFEHASHELINVKRMIASLIAYSEVKTSGKVLQNVETSYDKISSHSSDVLIANFEYDAPKSNKKSTRFSFKKRKTSLDTESARSYEHKKSSINYPMTALTLPIIRLAEPALTLAAMLDQKLSDVEIPKTNEVMLRLKPKAKRDIIPVNHNIMQEEFSKWVQKCMPIKFVDAFDHFMRTPSLSFKVVAVTLYEESQFMGFHGFADELAMTSNEKVNSNKKTITISKTMRKCYKQFRKSKVETNNANDSSLKSSHHETLKNLSFKSFYSFIKVSVPNNFVSKGANDYGFIELNSDFIFIKEGKEIFFKNCIEK